MSSKQQRQQMIVKIIASNNVSSQPELQKLLAKKKDRKSTRLNSSHVKRSRMPSSA